MNHYLIEGKPVVSRVQCTGDLNKSINTAVSLIGGFEKVVNKGDKILLKPNFNTADSPPASSDMESVRGVINLLYKNGAEKVILGESSTLLASTKNVMKKIGALRVAKDEGAEVTIFGKKGWKVVSVNQNLLKSVHLTKEIFDVDKIVYLCCLKTHNLTNFSGSLKHIVGLVRPFSRISWHLHGLEQKIAEANTVITPDLIILDARKCFIAEGPSHGKIAEPNLILASGNRVALDIEGIKIIKEYDGNSLKRTPWEYTQIRKAIELELGPKSEAEYIVVSK